MSTTSTVCITTDDDKPPAEIHIIYHREIDEGRDPDAQRDPNDDDTKPNPPPLPEPGPIPGPTPDPKPGPGPEPAPEIDPQVEDPQADDPQLDDPISQKTAINNIAITTHGPKPPAEIQVTVTCDVTNTAGHIPHVLFPAQGVGIPMSNTGGDTWTVSDTQMYGRGEKTLTITCNRVTVRQKFKA